MQIFLPGKKLWEYILGEIKKPEEDEEDKGITDNKILACIGNTVITSINKQFDKFETDKDIPVFISYLEIQIRNGYST